MAALPPTERQHRAPLKPLPEGAANCHMHVFGSFARFPRAVAVVDADVSASELASLHAAGVRGLRLNFQTLGGRYAGDAAQWLAKFEQLAAPHGWHLQLFCDAGMLAGMEPALLRSKTHFVIDHMGLPEAAAGVDQPCFQTALRLLRSKNIWVKLAGADRITRSTVHDDAILPYRDIDAGEMMDVLIEAIPGADTQRAILSDNPERLYGFER